MPPLLKHLFRDNWWFVFKFHTFTYAICGVYLIFLGNSVYVGYHSHTFLQETGFSPQSLWMTQKMLLCTITVFGVIGITVKISLLVGAFAWVLIGMLVYQMQIYIDGTTFFHSSNNFHNDTTPSSLCRILGLIFLLIPATGCFAIEAHKKKMFLMYLRIFIIGVMFFVKLGMFCMTFTTNAEAVRNSLVIPISNISDHQIQLEIDYIQTSFHCCGNDGYKDYVNIELPERVLTAQVADEGGSVVVPASCCVSSSNRLCTNVHASGCKHRLAHFEETKHLPVWIIGVCLSLMILDAIAIRFSCELIETIRKQIEDLDNVSQDINAEHPQNLIHQVPYHHQFYISNMECCDA